ncbi:hypothetical protein BD309DRAFT_905259 [Dichomitus squalens]|nr:hypothetical protein BD309DRAFT_905259 [Dichomitus squalens]
MKPHRPLQGKWIKSNPCPDLLPRTASSGTSRHDKASDLMNSERTSPNSRWLLHAYLFWTSLGDGTSDESGEKEPNLGTQHFETSKPLIGDS